jgi:hypothetical protein
VKELKKKRFLDWKRNEAAIIVQRNFSCRNRDNLKLARVTLASLRSFRKLCLLVEDKILTNYCNEMFESQYKVYADLLHKKFFRALDTVEENIIDSEVDYALENILFGYVLSLIEEENRRITMERVMLEEQMLMMSEDTLVPSATPPVEEKELRREEENEPFFVKEEEAEETDVIRRMSHDFVDDIVSSKLQSLSRPTSPSELFVDSTIKTAVAHISKSFSQPEKEPEQYQQEWESLTAEKQAEFSPLPNRIANIAVHLTNTAIDAAVSRRASVSDSSVSFNFDSTVASRIGNEDSLVTVDKSIPENEDNSNRGEKAAAASSVVTFTKDLEKQDGDALSVHSQLSAEQQDAPLQHQLSSSTLNTVPSKDHDEESVTTVVAVSTSAETIKECLELIAQGKYEESLKNIDNTLKTIQRALESHFQKYQDPHHSSSITSSSGLDPTVKSAKLSIVGNVLSLLKARAFYNTGRYKEAREELVQVMNDRVKLLGERHYLTGEVYFYMAEWYRSQGFYIESETWYLKADSLLVECLMSENNYASSVTGCEDDLESSLGDDASIASQSFTSLPQQQIRSQHPSSASQSSANDRIKTGIIQDFNNRADPSGGEKNTNFKAGASVSLKEDFYLHGTTDLSSSQPHKIASTSSRLTSGDQEKQEREEMIELSSPSLLITQSIDQPDPTASSAKQMKQPSFYTVYKLYHRNIIAYTELLRNTGQYYKSFQLMKKLQSSLLQYKDLGVQSFEVKEKFLSHFIKLKIISGDYSSTTQQSRDLLDKRRLHYGLIHYKVATSLYTIGKLLLTKCQYQEAILFIEDSYHLRIQLYPSFNHPCIGKGMLLKGEGFYHLGYYDLAIEETHKALEVFTRLFSTFNPFHPMILQCYSKIYFYYYAIGEPKASFNGLNQLLNLRYPSVTADGKKDVSKKESQPNKAAAASTSLVIDSELSLPYLTINYHVALNYLLCGNIIQAKEVLTHVVDKYDLILHQINGKSEYLENKGSTSPSKDEMISPVDYEMIKFLLLSTEIHSLKLPEIRKQYKRLIRRMTHLITTPNVYSASYLLSFAELSKIRGNYLDAKSLANLSYDMIVELHGESHPMICLILIECADNLRIPGYYDEVLAINSCALKLAFDLYPINDEILAEDQSQPQYESYSTRKQQFHNSINQEIHNEIERILQIAIENEQKQRHENGNLTEDDLLSKQAFEWKENIFIMKILFSRVLILRDMNQLYLAESFALYILHYYVNHSLSNTGIYAMTLNALGDIYRLQGKYRLSKGILLKSLKLANIFYGNTSYIYLEILMNIALLLMDCHAWNDSFALWLNEILPLIDSLFSNKHPFYYFARVNFIMNKFYLENESILLGNSYMGEKEGEEVGGGGGGNGDMLRGEGGERKNNEFSERNNQMILHFMNNHNSDVNAFYTFWNNAGFSFDHPWMLRMKYQLSNSLYYLAVDASSASFSASFLQQNNSLVGSSSLVHSYINGPPEGGASGDENDNLSELADDDSVANNSYSKLRPDQQQQKQLQVAEDSFSSDQPLPVVAAAPMNYSSQYSDYRRGVLSVISEKEDDSVSLSWTVSQQPSMVNEEEATYTSSLSTSLQQRGSSLISYEADNEQLSQKSERSYPRSYNRRNSDQTEHSVESGDGSFASRHSYRSYRSQVNGDGENLSSYSPKRGIAEVDSNSINSALDSPGGGGSLHSRRSSSYTEYTHSTEIHSKLRNTEESSFGDEGRGSRERSNKERKSEKEGKSQKRGRDNDRRTRTSDDIDEEELYDDDFDAGNEEMSYDDLRGSHSLAEASEITYESRETR